MSKKGISRFTLRLAIIASVLTCALFAFAGAVYADESSDIPDKVDGKYVIQSANQFVNYLKIASGSNVQHWDAEQSKYIVDAPGEKGASCVFANDIEFTSETLYYSCPFTTEANAFTGTIDGAGHKVTGVPSTLVNGFNCGNYAYNQKASTFFPYMNGTIKNIEFDYGELTLKGNATGTGVLVTANMGIISGVKVKGNVTFSMAGNVSLLVGNNMNSGAMILDSSTHGSLTASTGAAGIIGNNITSQAGMIKNCYNMANITVTGGTVGGIVRQVSGNVIKLENLYNGGTITLNGSEITSNDLGGSAALYTNSYGKYDTFTAADLGDAFEDDDEVEPMNYGYPVLKYELNKENYPEVEGADTINVTEIKKVTDTSILFTSDSVFEYYEPKTSDFSVNVELKSGLVATLNPTTLSWGNKPNKNLVIPSIAAAKTADGKSIAATTEQKATVKLLVAGKVAAEAEYNIPASTKWSDYAIEPETVGNDDARYGKEYKGYYKVTSPEELAWIAKAVANSSGGYFNNNVLLVNDIELNDTSDPDWKESADLMYWDIPIGYSANSSRSFSAVFDGRGYKVKGMYFDPDVARASIAGIQSGGLFGAIYASAEIKDLVVEDSYVEGKVNQVMSVGGICGTLRSGGTITNCSFDGEVKDGNYAGGIAATSESSQQERKITGCSNFGKVTNSGSYYAAGILAQCQTSNRVIEDCYNMGAVKSGNNQAAGIIAYCNSTSNVPTIRNAYNAGRSDYSISPVNGIKLENVYALEGTGTVSGSIDIFTSDEATDGTLLGYLDSAAFAADDDNINNGFPILEWQSPLTDAKNRYPEELDDYVDPEDYGVNKDELERTIADAKDAIANAKSSAEAAKILEDAKAAIDEIQSDADIKEKNAKDLEELRQQIENAEKTYNFNACIIGLAKTSFAYTGKANEPKVKMVSSTGAELVMGTDYEVAYDANVDPGVAKATVTGKGNYIGSRKLTFKIAPKKNKITSLKKAKKAFTVKWTKDAKATGYQVSYGLKKNFKGAKTAKITKKATVSKKISKLKAKKKYFVRVRSYVTSGGQTIYGAWSGTKSIKTK